jgi:hypothetical protein
MDRTTLKGTLAAALAGVALTGGMMFALKSIDTTPTGLAALPSQPLTFGTQPPAPDLGPRSPGPAAPPVVVPTTVPTVAPPPAPVPVPTVPPAVPPPLPGPVLPSHRPAPPPASKPAPVTGQGPAPVAVVAHSAGAVAGHTYDTLAVAVYAVAQDIDGYVTKFVIDYGDGTRVTRAGSQTSCRLGGDGWPTGDAVSLAGAPQHTYAVAGTYRVKVIAYSTGCDGTDLQSGSKAFTWDAHV